jgi:hypothetical protein
MGYVRGMMLDVFTIEPLLKRGYNRFMIVQWTDYMKYKSKLRGFDLTMIEQIVKYSPERYIDTVTGRRVAVGCYENILVVIPYEQMAIF